MVMIEAGEEDDEDPEKNVALAGVSLNATRTYKQTNKQTNKQPHILTMPSPDVDDKRKAAREVIDILHEIATLLVRP
jgi:hypothetical protein